MKSRHHLAVLVAGVAAIGAVWAGPAPMGAGASAAMPGATSAATTAPGAPAYLNPGKNLAANCFQCHGTNGKQGQFDSLAGESAQEIYSEMKEFQTSTSTGDEAIMKIHALGYTDEQLWQIAIFFESQK